MSMTTDEKYDNLKTSIAFFSSMLEEGSLVDRYEQETREEIADVLRLLVEKVEGLPVGCPRQLVEATAVRAIVDASEFHRKNDEEDKRVKIERRMREAEMAARLKGLELNEWEQIGAWEYQSGCNDVDGFVYVSPDSTFDLLGISEEMMLD